MKKKKTTRFDQPIKIKGGFDQSFDGIREKPAKVTGIVSLKLGNVGSKEKPVKI